MSSPFTRAQMLRQHRRHEEAVAMLHSHLAHHPDDPSAHIELALNRIEMPGSKTQALEDARKATGLSPNDPFPLALQANILSQLDREKEALVLADSAIAVDPEDVYSWNAKTLALCGLSRWKEAEETARKALELDPDDESASNLMAHVLRLQNKLEESEQESRRRLARDPDNAFSFANAGWAALQRRQVKEAEDLFKEALRLQPDLKFAKDGLKESYRARSGFYRLFLRWAFFMQRFNEKYQMLIIIGLIFGFRIVRALAAAVHPLLALLVVIVYYMFLFGTWLSSGIANFLILKDPVARLSLDRSEKAEGIAIGVLFLGGLLAVAVGAATGMLPVAVAGGTMMIAAIPASMVFTNGSVKGRLVFGACMAAVLILGSIVAIDMAANPNIDLGEGKSSPAFGFMVLIAMGSTWLAMVPSLRKAKPE
jgi:tetratricopeptide (TPR) repeat protein